MHNFFSQKLGFRNFLHVQNTIFRKKLELWDIYSPYGSTFRPFRTTYMVSRAILVKLMQNEQLETLTLAVFKVQKGNVPFWKWQKNRVQMV